MKAAYCPVCKEALDDENRCWGVCALAGIAQPPIHVGEFEADEYVCRNGVGEVVRTYTTQRLIPRGESEAVLA